MQRDESKIYRLYLVYLPGCEVCAQTKPEVKAWVKAHGEVKLILVDYSVVEWKGRWMPTIVPTLLLMVPTGKVHRREHGANRAKLDEWVREVAPELLTRAG